MIKDYSRTKIIATIGPASQDREILKKMFEAGVDVCRLNFSHETHEVHGETMKTIRAELDKSNPGLFLYGEGWAADQSPMPENLRAVKNNTSQLPGIASFNDDFRDALKGNHGSKKSKGFLSITS